MILLKTNYYKTSIKEFKKVIKDNKYITEEEWNNYAQKNNLFSSFTLISKETGVKDFNELKKQHLWF